MTVTLPASPLEPVSRPMLPLSRATVGIALPQSRLSDEEQQLVGLLRGRLHDQFDDLTLVNDYYCARQRMTDMGVSLPPELKGARAVLGWPRLAADVPHERLDIEGFRYPDALDVDRALWDIWQDSNLDSESTLAHLDALVFGRSFVVVGTNDDGSPLITVESPLNMAALWDNRLRHPRAVLQTYRDDLGNVHAALYLPDQTVSLSQDSHGQWLVEDRDQHRLGWVSVMMMTNRSRPHDRMGASEITPAIRHYTDAGCRTLLDLEISREFYAAPQRYILGATERAFQDADGNPKSAWETYRGRMLALERDKEGNVPEVGSFAAYDPSVYTRVMEGYAKEVASELGVPPSYVGLTTDQPASADSIRMSTDRVVQKVRRKQRLFEQAWEGAMRMALAFANGGVIPDQAKRIETIWRSPEVPTPAATTDSVAKQVAAGYMPPRSDVAGETLGYSPLQRARIKAEWQRADAQAATQAILDRATSTQPQPQAPSGQGQADNGQPTGDTTQE